MSLKKKNKNNLFSSLISNEDAKNIIKNSFLPGISPIIIRHRENLKKLEEILNTKKEKEGVYVCDCGFIYTILPCGYPIEIKKCEICKNQIGGLEHKIVKREGHMRIFRDKYERQNNFLNLNYIDKNMNNMLLNEYKEYIKKKENVILSEKEHLYPDFISKNSFINENNEKTREMDNLTYRVMNFILYSHIFYSYLLNILSENEIKFFLINNMDLYDILENDWTILEKLIRNYENIEDMQQFINIIYYILENELNNCEKIFDTKEKRDLYEKQINNKINNLLNINKINLEELQKNYEENLKLLKLDKKSIYILINEKTYAEDKEYIEDPCLKDLQYFMLSNCPDSKLLKEKIKFINDKEKKYPLLNQILFNKQRIEYLQNLPTINKVCNLLLQKYSFNITRKEAKTTMFSKEKDSIINDFFGFNENSKNKFNNLMEKYTKCWNNIKYNSNKYLCGKEMNIHEIINYEEELLANYLVDDGELNYGMYLASAYQNFIEEENIFIDNISKVVDKNDTLHQNYIKQLNKEIRVQDAEQKDIPELCSDIKLQEIINECSMRKCFNYDGNIIYNNYYEIDIDLNRIEEFLCELYLPGIKRFKVDDISFITYKYEGFRGKNSQILTNYQEKYIPKKLINEEITKIFEFIENENSKEKYEFLFDLQKIINYIQNENYENEHKVNDIIKKMPSIIHLSEKIRNFFNNNDISIKKDDIEINLFTVNSLIEFYLLFEHLCWDEIRQNINKDYNKKLTEKQINELESYFKENNNNRIITKINLSTAIRRFISKYLSGDREVIEKNENNDLILELKRADLWDYSFVFHPYFEEEMEKIKKFNFKVSQSMDLYVQLGGDENLLQEIKHLIIEKPKNNEDNKNEDDYIKEKNMIIKDNKNENVIDEIKDEDRNDKMISKGNKKKKNKKKKKEQEEC